VLNLLPLCLIFGYAWFESRSWLLLLACFSRVSPVPLRCSESFIFLRTLSRYSYVIRPGRSEFESQLGQDFSLLHSIHNGCGVYPGLLSGRFPENKETGGKHHSLPSGVEVKNGGAVPPLPLPLHGMETTLSSCVDIQVQCYPAPHFRSSMQTD
jgi:hypothetical protein